MTTREYADVVIVGSGITGALTAQWIANKTSASILMIEAGVEIPLEERFDRRERFLKYGEWPWPEASFTSLRQEGKGVWPNFRVLGGMATHWGAQAPRYEEECFHLKTLYGASEDWPISYSDLEPWYGEAERLIGVSGDSASSTAPRSSDYPMPAMPLNFNLALIKEWAQKGGVECFPRSFAINSVAYGSRPACARYDTCQVCPTGAKYSPDFTVRQLVETKRISLLKNVLVRKLETDPSGKLVVGAQVMDATTQKQSRVSGKVFVLATGTIWTPYLLLLSGSNRYPNGLANSSQLVGRYIVGHHSYFQSFRIPHRLYPGLHYRAALSSTQFLRADLGRRRGRWDMVLHAGEQPPPLAHHALGTELMKQWERETRRGVVNVSSMRESIPHRDSAVTLSHTRKTTWGDPLPVLTLKDSGLLGGDKVNDEIYAVGDRLAKAGVGRFKGPFERRSFDHRSGGCRMGHDPKTSVCDTVGRCHDLENLFVAGAPLCVTGGATNSTLTFSALALRTAEVIAQRFAPSARGIN